VPGKLRPMSGPPPVTPVPSVDAARESMAAVTERLEATMERASFFSEEERDQRVDGEWSTIESLRHITFVVDVWLSKQIRGEEDPFHPIGLPPHFMPPKLPGSSIDPDARPSFDEACDVLRGRIAAVQSYVDGLTPEELDRPNESHAKTAAGALSIIFVELNAHDRFINRDLDTIETSRGA
jgi:hypothetical protein